MTDHQTDLRELLRELHALVQGECPSLLNEDSGGDAALASHIDAALAAQPEREQVNVPACITVSATSMEWQVTKTCGVASSGGTRQQQIDGLMQQLGYCVDIYERKLQALASAPPARATTAQSEREQPLLAKLVKQERINGIGFGDRVVHRDYPHKPGTVLRCDADGLDIRYDDGTLGEAVWRHDVAHSAYPFQLLRPAASSPARATRLCVTCSKVVDAEQFKPGDSHPDCADPSGMSACTFDMTEIEAINYWRQKYPPAPAFGPAVENAAVEVIACDPCNVFLDSESSYFECGTCGCDRSMHLLRDVLVEIVRMTK